MAGVPDGYPWAVAWTDEPRRAWCLVCDKRRVCRDFVLSFGVPGTGTTMCRPCAEATSKDDAS